MMRSAGRRREDARRSPFRVAGPRRPPVRSRPRRDGRGQWGGRGERDGGPMHIDDRGPVRARVCCAPFPLLRLLTLHCTRKKGVAEGEGAQQTEKDVADAKRRSRQPGAVARGRGRPGPTPPPPAPARARRVVDDRLRRTMRHVSMHHPQRFHHPRTGMRDNPETPHHAVE